jgi:activator of HSP90 ATPase
MRNIIRQSVVLPAAADALFGMYLDPAMHSAFTGFPVSIGEEPGTAFRAFDGQLSGTMLAAVRPRLIVQSWRSTKFAESEPDSTLILLFAPDASDVNCGRIDLVHLDVPEHDFQGVTEGWQKHYWTPWRAYLERPSK